MTVRLVPELDVSDIERSQVGDLPAVVASMKEADVHFRNEIVTGPGGKQILIEDCAGNLIELFEPAG